MGHFKGFVHMAVQWIFTVGFLSEMLWEEQSLGHKVQTHSIS